MTLHLPTTNGDHMISVFWDMVHNRQNFFSFYTPVPPLEPEKSKFWWNEKRKTKKNALGYYHFADVYHKWKPYDEKGWEN